MAALRAGEAAAARRAFEAALAEGESGEVLEGLAEALYLERQYAVSAAQYERAYSAYRRERDPMAAGRAARTAGWITGNVLGDWAVQSGWFARARSILEQAGEDRPEHGWVLIIRSYTEPDPQVRESLLREAMAIGRRFGDPEIEFEALGYLGALFVITDRVEEGMVLLDEAMAAACAGELTDLAIVDSMFCGFYWACELVNDVPRADQWMRAAADIMKRRNVVAAFCRAHYGGILTAAGRWNQAQIELVEAARHFDRGMSSRRDAAIIRLGDLRVRPGRLEEAARLLEGLEEHPDSVRALAALHLARGEVARARDLLERATRGPYLKAAAALARGQVRIASGKGDARASLHDALEGFARARLPMELARTRLAMARALSERSPEVAIAEAKAALEGFERLEAVRHADAAAAVL